MGKQVLVFEDPGADCNDPPADFLCSPDIFGRIPNKTNGRTPAASKPS